jgi:hypothetical protein
MVMDQSEDRRVQTTVPEKAPGEELGKFFALFTIDCGIHKSDRWDDEESTLSSVPGDDNHPAVTPQTSRTEGTRRPTPPADPEREDEVTPVIRPAPKRRYGKQKDTGIGDQDESREDDDQMQLRAAKRRKVASLEPQAKPKPKPVGIFTVCLVL